MVLTQPNKIWPMDLEERTVFGPSSKLSFYVIPNHCSFSMHGDFQTCLSFGPPWFHILFYLPSSTDEVSVGELSLDETSPGYTLLK